MRSEPVVLPVVETGGELLRNSLIEQRRILISGPLERQTITELSAQLMAFDGSSSRDVEIVISSPGGAISDIMAALDVLSLMRAKVNVTAIGSVSGTAVALVAACTGERRAAAHAMFSLRLDAAHSIEGTASEIVGRAGELSRLHARYTSVLAAATGQEERAIANEIERGRPHAAGEALALGIVDAVAPARHHP